MLISTILIIMLIIYHNHRKLELDWTHRLQFGFPAAAVTLKYEHSQKKSYESVKLKVQMHLNSLQERSNA